jgi:hypothetical protein
MKLQVSFEVLLLFCFFFIVAVLKGEALLIASDIFVHSRHTERMSMLHQLCEGSTSWQVKQYPDKCFFKAEENVKIAGCETRTLRGMVMRSPAESLHWVSSPLYRMP